MDGMFLASVVVFSLAAIVLVITIIVEAREYRQYRKAAYGVIALGEAMNSSFGEVANHLNRFQEHLVEMGEGLETIQQEFVFMQSIIEIHSEALNLSLGKVKSYGEVNSRKV